MCWWRSVCLAHLYSYLEEVLPQKAWRAIGDRGTAVVVVVDAFSLRRCCEILTARWESEAMAFYYQEGIGGRILHASIQTETNLPRPESKAVGNRRNQDSKGQDDEISRTDI